MSKTIKREPESLTKSKPEINEKPRPKKKRKRPGKKKYSLREYIDMRVVAEGFG